MNMIPILILLCILPQHHGQNLVEWPWSEATVRFTSIQGSFPRDRRPNLATVVLHDSEVYHSSDWGWDQKDWSRTLTGTFGEKIQVGCRKVEGSSHEKASSIAIAGNFLESNITSSLHPNITANLCHTTAWACEKQVPFILCCRQRMVGNFPLDPSTNNVEITRLCKDESGDCWHNFTLTKPTYITCNWQKIDQSGLQGLVYKFKMNVVAKPILSMMVVYQGENVSLMVDDKNKVFPPFVVSQGDDIAIRCELNNGTHAEPVHGYNIGPHGRVLSCEFQNQNCWLNLTNIQFSHKIMCGKNNTKCWGELDVDVVMPTSQPPVVLTPKIFEIGPYIIKKTGQQQILFNPTWSLKQVKLLMQNNISEIQPACLPFLQTSFEGWDTWLQKRSPSKKRMTRDNPCRGNRVGNFEQH
ncbi:uncharacterized protein LOC134563398 [Prinia subflava]|uniref:uncharacterized protein LOC134563398 n=1 Tax=Prinia subflava TaxID=208062 RepID=UPI002FDF4253